MNRLIFIGLFFVVIIVIQRVSAETINYRLEHIYKNAGLPNGEPVYITQDSRGFLWIGTKLGLYRYDGYEFRKYPIRLADGTVIVNDFIFWITEDPYSNLWLSTWDNGLVYWIRDKELSYQYLHDPDDPHSIAHNKVNGTFIDSKGYLWVGTYGGGANRSIQSLNNLPEDSIPSVLSFLNFKHDPGEKNSLAGNVVRVISEDSDGRIWIGTHGGLSLLNREDEGFSFKNYTYDPEESTGLCGAWVSGIVSDTRGIMWFSTYGGGICRYNPEGDDFTQYRHDPENIKSLQSNNVYGIRQDPLDRNLLWMPMPRRGFCRFNKKTGEVTRFASELSETSEAIHANVIYPDRSGIVWIGASPFGMCKLHRNEQFNYFKAGLFHGSEKNIKCEWITCIFEFDDEQNIIWLGTENGLFALDPETEEYKHYVYKSKPEDRVRHNFIRAIIGYQSKGNKYLILGMRPGLRKFDCEQRKFIESFTGIEAPLNYPFGPLSALELYEKKNLWIGTRFHDVYRFDFKTGTLFHYDQLKRPERNCISDIYIENDTTVWITSLGNGIFRLNPHNGNYENYLPDSDDPFSLISNSVYTILKTNDNKLWFGTAGGLEFFERKSGRFSHYFEKDESLSLPVLGLLEEPIGIMWISTYKGLSKFNYQRPMQQEVETYKVSDGLITEDFSMNSCFRNSRGKLYFGGYHGMIIFDPATKARKNMYTPPVVLTHFYLSHKLQTHFDASVLTKPITETREIILKHNQNDFSFEFAALDFTIPMKNQYAYKMTGMDEDWVHTDAANRRATYTNVNSGKYTFQVRASNNDGIWNEEGVTLRITTLPPWYKSNLAYIFYFLIFITLLYGTWRYQLQRIRVNHQLEIEHLNAEKLKEVNQVKNRFFANISHEFRTPITLILAPITQMISKEFRGNIEDGYRIICSNANKLLRMVNQLLALSKLEAGQLNLQVIKADIVSLVDRIFNTFLSLAEHRNIDFRFNNEVSFLEMYFDREKLETILNNLLSNAFKFTPGGGSVEVKISTPLPATSPRERGDLWGCNKLKEGCIAISVTNSGPGIPKDEKAHIFDRFYQGNGAPQAGGTGIGLSLARELIELHHGRIFVESVPDHYTVFTIELPTADGAYQDDEKIELNYADADAQAPIESIPERYDNEKNSMKNEAIEKSTVLIVEDNTEMRRFLKQNMEEKYSILEAGNGKAAFDAALDQLPELIISDVMMPEMDGFTLCEKIKSDPYTSHIPVILLTARAGQEDKLAGLKTGADDYLPKPFEMEELLTRSANLIRQRMALKERFQKEALFGLRGIMISSVEQETLEHIQEIIDHNLNNTDYSNDDFARDLGMSRSQLHRKLKALCGLSPHEFIRLCRLKKAAILLHENAGNVTSIAYEVGFKNISHFARLFEKQFGIKPKQFS